MLARYGFAALAVSMAAVVYRYDLLAVVRSGRFSPVKVHEEDTPKTLPKTPNVLEDQPTTNNKGDEGLGKGSFTSFASIAERDHLKATLQNHQLKSMKADSDEDQHTMDHRYTCLDYIKASAVDGTSEQDITNVMSGRMDDGEDCCSYVTGPYISPSDKRLYSIAISVCRGAAVDFGGLGGYEMVPSSKPPPSQSTSQQNKKATTGKQKPPPSQSTSQQNKKATTGKQKTSSVTSKWIPCPKWIIDATPAQGIIPTDHPHLLKENQEALFKQEAMKSQAVWDCYTLYLRNVKGGGYDGGGNKIGGGTTIVTSHEENPGLHFS